MSPEQIKANYQESYEAFFGVPAPEVRISEPGSYYIREPVRKQYSEADLLKVIRFYQRGV